MLKFAIRQKSILTQTTRSSIFQFQKRSFSGDASSRFTFMPQIKTLRTCVVGMNEIIEN